MVEKILHVTFSVILYGAWPPSWVVPNQVEIKVAIYEFSKTLIEVVGLWTLYLFTYYVLWYIVYIMYCCKNTQCVSGLNN